MKFLFFFMGLPIMIMSFFNAADALPYAENVSLLSEGKEIVLTQEQQSDLKDGILSMFENSRTLPAFAVVTDEMFKEDVQSGTFVSLKFNQVMEVEGLPFDEIVFKVVPEYSAINLLRGNNGVFQGRCIHVQLDKNMQDLNDIIDQIQTKTEIDEKI